MRGITTVGSRNLRIIMSNNARIDEQSERQDDGSGRSWVRARVPTRYDCGPIRLSLPSYNQEPKP